MEKDEELLSLNTLARILTLYFSPENRTKITPTALTLIAQYLKIYTKEAVCRAYEDKKEKMMTGDDDEVVLEIEDLENGVAAQLALDFS